MATIIAVTDLPEALQSVELAELMVAGANAKASRVAPCLTWAGEDAEKPAPSSEMLDEARLVLIGAVRRWVESGSGAMKQHTLTRGPFGETQTYDDRQKSSGYNLWPSEIADLQAICSAGSDGTGRMAFSIDTAPTTSAHLPWCALMFAANYCSCGVDLANGDYPLYEGGVLTAGDDY